MPDHRAQQRHRGHRGPGRRRGGKGGGVARFMEPGALLLLREGPAHGYELAEELSDILAIERVDVGNLYRLLRRLEDDGLVTSVWDDANGGRAKRVYELTEEGAEVLDDWAPRLAETRDALNRFLERHASGRSSENETAERQHDETGETEQHDPT